MVKAHIKRPDGSQITIEGSEDEINRIVSLVSGTHHKNSIESKKSTPKRSSKVSIEGLLMELKTEGFFNKPKRISEIKDALDAKGRIYEVTTLSAQLIRQTRKRNLGRIKSEKRWKYVTR